MTQKFCILTWRLDAKILHSHFPAKFITKSTTKNGSCRNSAFQRRNRLDAKILHSHISAKFIKNQQQIDNAEILHFNFDTCKIWMQKFCRAIFLLNSLKNQQQLDNAEILHFNFDTYKIWMQKFCRASFRQIQYKNNITKLVSKCAGGTNEQPLKTSGCFLVQEKAPKNLRRGGN